MATLKPFDLTADNLDDLKMQANTLFDKMWSIFDNITGYAKTQTLQSQDQGNTTKQAVPSSMPNVQVQSIQNGAVGAAQTNSNSVALTGEVFQSNFPQAGSIGWNKHQLTYQGTTYDINAGSTSDAFVYWTRNATTYSTTNNALDTLNNFAVAANSQGTAQELWNSSSAVIIAQQIATGVLQILNGTSVNSSFGGDKDGNRDGNAYFYDNVTGNILAVFGYSADLGSFAGKNATVYIAQGGRAFAVGIDGNMRVNGVLNLKSILSDADGDATFNGTTELNGPVTIGNTITLLNITGQSGAPTYSSYVPILRDINGNVYFIRVYHD